MKERILDGKFPKVYAFGLNDALKLRMQYYVFVRMHKLVLKTYSIKMLKSYKIYLSIFQKLYTKYYFSL